MKPQPFTPQQWKQAGAHFPETSKPSQAQRGKEPAADAPTPPELALIAATLARGRRDNAAGLVERGAELWRAAARASCVEALRGELVEGVFRLSESRWNEILDDYAGDRQFLADTLDKISHSFERVIEQLFRHKGTRAKERHQREFIALLEYANNAGVSDEVKRERARAGARGLGVDPIHAERMVIGHDNFWRFFQEQRRRLGVADLAFPTLTEKSRFFSTHPDNVLAGQRLNFWLCRWLAIHWRAKKSDTARANANSVKRKT